MSHALIIGSNSDIALKIIEILVKKKWRISLASKNIDKIFKLSKDLELRNIKSAAYKIDLEKLDTFDNFILNISNDINTIIFTAGYLEKPEINKEKIDNINYKGPKILLEKILRNKKFNSIKNMVIISSVSADRKNYKETSYSLSKFKLSNFTKIIQNRYTDINILEFKLGYVKTKMTKNLNLPFFLVSSPGFIARKIVYNLDKKKKIIYLPFYWKYILIIYNFLK
ncbi:MAG: hypothetical protein CBB97_00865 [Candidatus Endolissoclinum sp. TMED37]|nr:MAG: hypothetical protein CBB97_00865 [Candidatus Endolissoclinum sp. TMED37]|tara:strand:- start:1370 stop:2047 length:678 start_codon:yes stop_codon:yes gene_type:complete